MVQKVSANIASLFCNQLKICRYLYTENTTHVQVLNCIFILGDTNGGGENGAYQLQFMAVKFSKVQKKPSKCLKRFFCQWKNIHTYSPYIFPPPYGKLQENLPQPLTWKESRVIFMGYSLEILSRLLPIDVWLTQSIQQLTYFIRRANPFLFCLSEFQMVKALNLYSPTI